MVTEVSCSDIAIMINGRASNPVITVDNISSLESANNSSISFLSDKAYIPALRKTSAKVILLKDCDIQYWSGEYITVKDPYLAFAKVAQFFSKDKKKLQYSIHKTAIFGDNLKVASQVRVGPLSCFGDNVVIKERVIIESNVSVSDNVSIGKNTIIHSNVSISDGVVIGDNCEIFSGTVIGSDGFGYASDKSHWVKIPQTGSVLIEDNVDIGANTTIDRGAIDNTVIESGVKIDNLVHIGHNCSIGSNSIISGMAGFAGSVKIGKNCMIGGGARLAPNIKVADNVIISPATIITKSLLKPGKRYTGFLPYKEHKDFLRFAVKLRKDKND